MQQYEYKVVPAPKRGTRQRGLKTVPDRFAFALTQLMNEMAAQGWEYLRADTLPCEEKVGLTGKATNFHTLLVFRKACAAAVAVAAPAAAPPVVAPPAAVSAAEPADPAPSSLPPLRLGAAKAEAGAAPAIGGARTDIAAQ